MRVSSILMAIVLAGLFISGIYGFIGSIQKHYSIEVDDHYNDVYNKISDISGDYVEPMKLDIEKSLPTATESAGYFRGLDRAWEAIKTPFKLVSLMSSLLEALIIDLQLPSWVNWGNIIGTLIGILVLFLLLSAIIKWRI